MKTEPKTLMRLCGAVILTGSLSGLTACASMDPLTRDDVWRPTHINEANLELQVAHPSDLTVGRGTLTADGDTAAKAVDRLRNDKVKPLPTASISSVGQSGGGS